MLYKNNRGHYKIGAPGACDLYHTLQLTIFKEYIIIRKTYLGKRMLED